jgi:hypothetical protein
VGRKPNRTNGIHAGQTPNGHPTAALCPESWSLTHTGTKITDAVRWVAKHPLMAPVVHAVKATLALVRPVSRGFVANRLLAAVVPVLWLRAVIEFLFMPLLVDTSLVGTVRDWATTQPADADPATTDDAQGTDGAVGDVVISTSSDAIPMPGREVPDDLEQADAEEADVVEQANEEPADEDHHLNRASRRAQQREDAHARRMHPRR